MITNIGPLWKPDQQKRYIAQGNLDLSEWTGKDGVTRNPKKDLIEALMSGEKISLFVFPNEKKQPGTKQPDYRLAMGTSDEPVQPTQPEELPPVDQISVDEIPFG